MSKSWKPLLLGLLAALFWGTHSSIVRFLSADIPGITSAALRLYIAAATLALFLAATGHRPRIDLRAKGLWPVVLALAANFVLFHMGLAEATPTSAMLLENTAPVFVLLILYFGFRERPHWMEVLASLLVVFGAYWTVRADLSVATDRIGGDVLEILAGVTWAAFMVAASRSTSEDQTPVERLNFMMQAFIIAAVLMTPFTFLAPLPEPTGVDVLLIVLLGVFPTAIAYVLWYEAAAHVSTVVASLLFGLTIIFTFLIAAVFLGEEITSGMIAGAVMVVAGVVLAKFRPARE